MLDDIRQSTEAALKAITHPRLFETERGYASQFHVEIDGQFKACGLLKDWKRLLEMEYQKTASRHGTEQRPDLIFHIPIEVSDAPRESNNFAVWAFKRRGGPEKSLEDFVKLERMFRRLDYSVGIAINIGSKQDYLELYNGSFPERLYGATVTLKNGVVSCKMRHAIDVVKPPPAVRAGQLRSKRRG